MKAQGKFGWYPCDWQTYQKLKRINMAYNKAKYLYAIWQRWNRKDPQNRVAKARIRDEKGQVVGYGESTPMPEPPVCSVFCIPTLTKYDKLGNYVKEGIPTYFLKDLPIESDYRKARYPVAEKDVSNLSMSLEVINQLYDTILASLIHVDH